MTKKPGTEQGGNHRGTRRGGAEDMPASDSPERGEREDLTSPETSEGMAGAVNADLDAMLEETKRERDEYLELAQRTKADFENYRKRMGAEADQAERRGKSRLAEELIPVIDNLERALAAAGIDPAAALSGEVGADGALEQGVVLTYRELNETLARAGIEAYDPAGERFDPEWHEALSTRAQESSDPGTVLEVVAKGYRLDGRVVRPARVVVSE